MTQTGKLDLSVIVVSYNTAQLTLECLRSVEEQTKQLSYEVIVVDNNSSDDSSRLIANEFPDIELIALDDNIGFARANNLAAEQARGRRILLLNPDTVVLENAIDKLIEFADTRAEARIWGGRAYFPDRSINVSSWKKMTPWSITCRAVGLTWLFPNSRIFNPESVHMWANLKEELEVDIIVGCFLLIDRDLWDSLDGFNPVFYMYGDETDLCLRAKQFGASPMVSPDAAIIHYGGGSEPSSEEKLIKVLKGQITVAKAHWSRFWFRYAKAAFICLVALRAVGSLIIKPPSRKGGGQDGRRRIWGAVLRRRREWIDGWPL